MKKDNYIGDKPSEHGYRMYPVKSDAETMRKLGAIERDFMRRCERDIRIIRAKDQEATRELKDISYS